MLSEHLGCGRSIWDVVGAYPYVVGASGMLTDHGVACSGIGRTICRNTADSGIGRTICRKTADSGGRGDDNDDHDDDDDDDDDNGDHDDDDDDD